MTQEQFDTLQIAINRLANYINGPQGDFHIAEAVELNWNVQDAIEDILDDSLPEVFDGYEDLADGEEVEPTNES